MSGFAAKAVIILIVIALLVVIVARFFRRVAPAKQVTRRQRMPLLVALVGAGLLAAGAVLGLATLTAKDTPQLLPTRIAYAIVFVVGLALLVAFRNWYIEVGPDAVRFRTVLGREKRIAYRDIVSFGTKRVARRERVIVQARDGVRLSVDTGRYALAPLITAGRAAAS